MSAGDNETSGYELFCLKPPGRLQTWTERFPFLSNDIYTLFIVINNSGIVCYDTFYLFVKVRVTTVHREKCSRKVNKSYFYRLSKRIHLFFRDSSPVIGCPIEKKYFLAGPQRNTFLKFRRRQHKKRWGDEWNEKKILRNLQGDTWHVMWTCMWCLGKTVRVYYNQICVIP